MQNLLNLNFWINLSPPALLPVFLKTLIVFISVLAVLAFYFMVKGKKKNFLFGRVWRRLQSFCLGNTILGLIILFFTYEQVPLLSARFWFLVWGTSMIVWLYFIFKVYKEAPVRKEALEKEKEFKKYIP